MTRTYDFVQVDVFTRTALMGNPLAIFTDARGLTDVEMQALAREMNLSETTFILPREPQVELREGKRVRIFTPEEELPFAGHPTLGTALYIYSTTPAAPEELVLDLNVGKVPVRFTPDAKDAGLNRVDGALFGEMRQRDPEFGAILSAEEVARALGTDVSAIASNWPIQVVSTGLPFAIVPFSSSELLSQLKCVAIGKVDCLKGTEAKFFYMLAPQCRGSEPEARARMFFYGGEDPATGSAAGCAISWMARYGIAKNDEQVLIRQGVEAARPSEIFVRASCVGEHVTNVRVGGYAVEVLRGTVSL